MEGISGMYEQNGIGWTHPRRKKNIQFLSVAFVQLSEPFVETAPHYGLLAKAHTWLKLLVCVSKVKYNVNQYVGAKIM